HPPRSTLFPYTTLFRSVILSVRPEDIQLSETRPEGENVWKGSVDQKVFLGEAVDFQVKIRDRALQSRAHPSLRTRVGEPIYLRRSEEHTSELQSRFDLV